jgi:hypothetical protein
MLNHDLVCAIVTIILGENIPHEGVLKCVFILVLGMEWTKTNKIHGFLLDSVGPLFSFNYANNDTEAELSQGFLGGHFY